MSEMSGGFVRNERKDEKRMTEEKLYLAEKDGGAPYYLLRRVGHAYTRVAGIAAGISVNTGYARRPVRDHMDLGGQRSPYRKGGNKAAYIDVCLYPPSGSPV